MKDFIKKIFNKMNNWLGSLRKDLIIHAGVSALIYVLIFAILTPYLGGPIAAVWSTFITLSIGVVKEYLVDKLIRDSYADVQDLYADLVGTILGVIVTIPFMFYSFEVVIN